METGHGEASRGDCDGWHGKERREEKRVDEIPPSIPTHQAPQSGRDRTQRASQPQLGSSRPEPACLGGPEQLVGKEG